MAGYTIEKIETHDEWLKARRGGIGGSDAAVACGESPWTTEIELWGQKCGFIEPPDISDSPVIIYGKAAEDLIRELYKLDHKQYEYEYHPYWNYISKDYPFMRYTPDGLLRDRDGRLGIHEIKTTTLHKGSDWEKWNQDKDDENVPDYYFCQIMHGLNVIDDAEFVELTARIRWFNFGKLTITERTYHWDRANVLDQMQYVREKEEAFWRCVENKVAPAITLPRRNT